jgi:replicative DNA helicase
MPTGFDPLDEVLGGGLRTEQLTLVGGRPGIGKTIVTLQWARAIVTAGAVATVVCYEHSPREILDRLLALEVRSIARVDEEFEVDDARRAVLGIGTTGAAPSSPLAEEALRRVQSYGDRLHIVAADGRSTDLTALDGIAAATGAGATVFVDYLQKVPVPGALHDEDRSRTAVEGLKDLAMRHRVALVATAAVDRDGIAGRRLRLSHLRGSTALAHECDVAILLNEKATAVSKVALAYNTARADTFQRQVVFSVEKNRSGQADLHLEFAKDFANYRFDPRGGFLTEKLVDDVLYEE